MIETEQTGRLAILRKKFDDEGPSSLSVEEGEEFVKLMRAEAQSFARSKPRKAAKSTKTPAAPPSLTGFAAKLAALKAGKK